LVIGKLGSLIFFTLKKKLEDKLIHIVNPAKLMFKGKGIMVLRMFVVQISPLEDSHFFVRIG
jgi:hypothetical protein